MLKKLQNLLFEDDEDDYLDDDETEEEEQPIQVRPSHVENEPVKPAAVQTQPAPEKEQSHMNRIDVTGFVPVQEPAMAKQEPVKEEKKPLGITVDDDFVKVEKPKSAPAVRTVKQAKPKTQKQTKKPEKPVYEFQPVISPIFGVDEKDLNALKTTTRKVEAISSSHSDDDSNITPVISPIYGSTEGRYAAVKEETVHEEISVREEKPVQTPVAEDDIPEFSLDDILKVRDEEYSNPSEDLGNTAPLFPDLDIDFPDDPVEEEEKAPALEIKPAAKKASGRKKSQN